MNVPQTQKKIIPILFVVAIILLIANIIFGKKSNIIINENAVKISPDSVNTKFLHTLSGFGLKKEWIKENKSVRKGNSKHNYKVIVPSDLPITIILKSLFNSYDGENVALDVNEKKIDGETDVNVVQNDGPTLYAEFKYDKSIKRKAGNSGFLIDDFEDLNKKEMTNLLASPESFGVILTPSKEASNVIPNILDARKEFAVLLNDNIQNINYKLSKNFSTFRLKQAIRSIIGNYTQAIFFLIDSKSQLVKSPAYLLIKSEFAKRKITLIPTDSLTSLNENSSSTFLQNFENNVRQEKSGDKQLFLITKDQFYTLQNELSRLRKIGYKFINPSNITVANK